MRLEVSNRRVGGTGSIRFGLYARSATIGLVLLLAACAKPEERAERHYRKGIELLEKGHHSEAIGELSTAVGFKPDRLDAWRALASAQDRIGAAALYYRSLRRIVELDPNDAPAKLRLAKLMVRGGAADAALQVLDTVAGEEGNAEFHATKAAVLAAKKDGVGAIQAARKAIGIDPKNGDAALILAADLISRKDFSGALRLLNDVKVDDPKDTRVAIARIGLLEQTGDIAGAEAEVRALVAKKPDDMSMRTALVQLLARQRKHDEAEKELRTIADLNPSDSKRSLDLVRFIIATRGREAGRQELERLIAQGGKVFTYQIALSELAVAQNQPAEAISLLERLASQSESAEEKNTAKVKLAEIKSGQKDVPGAERLVADVLNGDRRNVGALRLRAAIRLDRGETDAAIADLREALNEQPKAADLLLLMGRAYERNGQKELADRQYAEAARGSEFNPAIVLRYVAFLQRAGNAARAEEVLMEAGRRNPQSVDLFSSLAQVRLSRQNWAGAMQIADAMSQNEPTKALGERIRAAALAGQNKPEESIAALERAQAAAPDAMGPLEVLVQAYARQKNYDKAESLLREKLRNSPKKSRLLVLLGQLQDAKGAPAEAVKTFEEAIKQLPLEGRALEEDALPYTLLASHHARLKRGDQALEVLDRGMKHLPGNLSLSIAKAGLLEARGQYDAAIDLYEATLKEHPGAIVAINNLASMLLDHRTDKASLDRGQILVERLKGIPQPHFLDTFGWALHLRGDYAAAKPVLEQAKSQLPNIAAVRYHLALTYRALGEEPQAIEELKAASVLETEETELKKKIRAALN